MPGQGWSRRPHAGVFACWGVMGSRVRGAGGSLAFVFMPRFLESALRNVSERDIQRALDAPFYDEGITTRRGNPGLLVQGPSASSGLPIEVLGEIDPDTGELVVYHAHWM